MDVGRAVAKLMRDKGILAITLCEETGLSQSYVSMLVHSKIPDPSLLRIKRIAVALGVTVDEVVSIAEGFEDPK